MGPWVGGYAAIAGLTWLPFTVLVLRGRGERLADVTLAGLVLAIGWPVSVLLWASFTTIEKVRSTAVSNAPLLDADGGDLLNPVDGAPANSAEGL